MYLSKQMYVSFSYKKSFYSMEKVLKKVGCYIEKAFKD